MGVTILNGLFLVEARAAGARFDATLTLGRINCFLTPTDLRRIAAALSKIDSQAASTMNGDMPRYMDEFFIALGAKRLDALDASDFEHAQLIHDLNEPLPERLHGQYDAVVDAGTLEHVFNVPTAFRNVMDALKVDGHFLALLPANNQCGHGFYQFSAEFFYRTFCAENGFEVVRLVVAPIYAGRRWLDGPAFDVADPETMGDRVNIAGRKQLVFMLHARKLAQTRIFKKWPQQSDYVAAWSATDQTPALPLVARRRSLKWLRRHVGALVHWSVRTYERWVWIRQSRSNRALKPHKWMY